MSVRSPVTSPKIVLLIRLDFGPESAIYNRPIFIDRDELISCRARQAVRADNASHMYVQFLTALQTSLIRFWCRGIIANDHSYLARIHAFLVSLSQKNPCNYSTARIRNSISMGGWYACNTSISKHETDLSRKAIKTALGTGSDPAAREFKPSNLDEKQLRSKRRIIAERSAKLRAGWTRTPQKAIDSGTFTGLAKSDQELESSVSPTPTDPRAPPPPLKLQPATPKDGNVDASQTTHEEEVGQHNRPARPPASQTSASTSGSDSEARRRREGVSHERDRSRNPRRQSVDGTEPLQHIPHRTTSLSTKGHKSSDSSSADARFEKERRRRAVGESSSSRHRRLSSSRTRNNDEGTRSGNRTDECYKGHSTPKRRSPDIDSSRGSPSHEPNGPQDLDSRLEDLRQSAGITTEGQFTITSPHLSPTCSKARRNSHTQTRQHGQSSTESIRPSTSYSKRESHAQEHFDSRNPSSEKILIQKAQSNALSNISSFVREMSPNSDLARLDRDFVVPALVEEAVKDIILTTQEENDRLQAERDSLLMKQKEDLQKVTDLENTLVSKIADLKTDVKWLEDEANRKKMETDAEELRIRRECAAPLNQRNERVAELELEKKTMVTSHNKAMEEARKAVREECRQEALADSLKIKNTHEAQDLQLRSDISRLQVEPRRLEAIIGQYKAREQQYTLHNNNANAEVLRQRKEIAGYHNTLQRIQREQDDLQLIRLQD